MIKVKQEKSDYLWCQSCSAQDVELFETEIILEQDGSRPLPMTSFRLCVSCYENMLLQVKKQK